MPWHCGFTQAGMVCIAGTHVMAQPVASMVNFITLLLAGVLEKQEATLRKTQPFSSWPSTAHAMSQHRFNPFGTQTAAPPPAPPHTFTAALGHPYLGGVHFCFLAPGDSPSFPFSLSQGGIQPAAQHRRTLGLCAPSCPPHHPARALRSSTSGAHLEAGLACPLSSCQGAKGLLPPARCKAATKPQQGSSTEKGMCLSHR